MSNGYKNIKYALDRIFSLAMTLGLSPLLLLISIIIKLDSSGPVLFQQRRIGKGNREFPIYKFRTMRTDAPKDLPTHLLDDPDAYITKMGGFLRKSSLDELPQLFNILKGEMSFIGPRPALWNQYDLIAARKKNGSDQLLPGITGWAQVNGRDELPVLVKADYDGQYAERISLGLDLRILFRTFAHVLTHKGVSEGGPK